MAKRNIVNIDEEKCNGCGLCVDACHEGALRMINGKAKLIKDDYCDGLGDCLPECPTGAITITQREAADFDAEAVKQRMAAKAASGCASGGCPGSMERSIGHDDAHSGKHTGAAEAEGNAQGGGNTAATADMPSQLRQWPVQLRLVSSNAGFLQGAHLLLAADCTPLAYANFHEKLLKGRVAIIACPKLDDYQEIVDKMADILRSNDIASITVVRMEVPCCGGITQALKQAMMDSGKIVPFAEQTVTLEGDLV